MPYLDVKRVYRVSGIKLMDCGTSGWFIKVGAKPIRKIRSPFAKRRAENPMPIELAESGSKTAQV